MSHVFIVPDVCLTGATKRDSASYKPASTLNPSIRAESYGSTKSDRTNAWNQMISDGYQLDLHDVDLTEYEEKIAADECVTGWTRNVSEDGHRSV